MTVSIPKKAALIILDGWGYRKSNEHNAIANANTPVWDQLLVNYPYTLIKTSGTAVGLPDGQMGNSEVGHMNIGAGRVVYQNYTKINKSIEDGSFNQNCAINGAIEQALKNDSVLHICGLLSPGGVHSHEKHFYAMCQHAAKKGIKKLYIHGILDGRDTPPQSAKASIEGLDSCLKELGVGTLVSLIGRYYAMDRDNRWDRVEHAYKLMTEASAEFTYANGLDALQASYERDENDEFMKASVICPEVDGRIKDNDCLIMMNFRPDRAREITSAFDNKNEFSGFKKQSSPQLSALVMMTEYAQKISADCAFPPVFLKNGLGEYISFLGLNQLRIAETEKYAHVSFFFSGGREEPYTGEERVLIPSPDVATYDLQPEMNAPQLTDQLISEIQKKHHHLIVCNYANGDMVGHTGVYSAVVKAAECIDICLSRLVPELLANDYDCLITADHGNAEEMINMETGAPLTSHTTGPVPLIYISNDSLSPLKEGGLSDIAPSILAIMGLPKPIEMTGESLIKTSAKKGVVS
jgi:2,3-bisphosphoglycerate-independent phosphoglycerate mutase